MAPFDKVPSRISSHVPIEVKESVLPGAKRGIFVQVSWRLMPRFILITLQALPMACCVGPPNYLQIITDIICSVMSLLEN